MVEEKFSLSWLQLCTGLVSERILLLWLHFFSDPLDFIGERLSLCWLWLLVLQVFLLGKGCYCLVTPFCWILGGEFFLLLGISLCTHSVLGWEQAFAVFDYSFLLASWLDNGFPCFDNTCLLASRLIKGFHC